MAQQQPDKIDLDLGFGAVVSRESRQRLLNRDGSFNVRRQGLNFWQEEGLLTHSLHTLVIDRDGRLAADFEGNEFSAEQLGDFVRTRIEK